MANSKKFLIPLTAAITSLVAVNSQATMGPKTSVTESKPDQTPSKLATLSRDGISRVVFAKGSELHSLLLARNEQGVILSDHESHASHSSHSSHRSHYSGY